MTKEKNSQKLIVMTGNEYQKLAMRTCQFDASDDREREWMIHHALFGLTSEVGEVLGCYQKSYQGHGLNINNLYEEIGDVLWMVAELCHAYGWSLENVMLYNIRKLKKRYPNGFDPERSIHRDEYGKD